MPAPVAIKVPSLTQLTSAPAASTEGTPPAAPIAKAGEGTPPVEIVEPKPPVVPAADEAPVLETEIIVGRAPNTAPVNTPKGAADFKNERLQKKQERQDIGQLQAEFDQTKQALMQRDIDLEKLRKDLADREKVLETQKKLAETRAKDLEDLRAGYFQENRATWNPLEDEQFQSASQTMLERLRNKLPIRVPSEIDSEGRTVNQSRVFFDTILQQNGAHQGLANMLDAYAMAKRNANEKGMNLAVNAMAQWLGASVDMTDPNEQNWKLLPASNETFKAIETALDEATPFHVARAERYAQVQREGPLLAKQQFENREAGIRKTLASSIFLPPDVATAALKADPNDSTALVAMLVNQVPALKELAESKLNDFAPAFAAMGDKLYLPGLSSANPAEIAAHRQREAGVRQTVSEAMRFAVIGAVSGPILSSVIAERDDAEERANAASLLTNPGGDAGSKTGKDGTPPAATLATEIVTGR